MNFVENVMNSLAARPPDADINQPRIQPTLRSPGNDVSVDAARIRDDKQNRVNRQRGKVFKGGKVCNLL